MRILQPVSFGRLQNVSGGKLGPTSQSSRQCGIRRFWFTLSFLCRIAAYLIVGQQMKNFARSIVFTLAAVALPMAHASPPPDLCKALRSFVGAVQPDERLEFTFRTSWGENFKDAPESALAAKRCEHNGYESAKNVCEYLMENGSTEFAGLNVQNSIACLSKKTHFAPFMRLSDGTFSFSYGSDNRGALIEITLHKDHKIGGMVFRLAADGY